ncbi:hypothetical protein FHR24_000877 [Wenyingzhuangia heitensis]|uniref:Auto-transporter adhesin head GIN domain-containing protein n=1 Tax=Wenyingzhuangia heitensis TaxID=1487859 RepID=A0ABX0U6Q8_9FLAO|nr:hypothetical protein [Wenyingzhuangia heitensis]NIJ44438.1 hypothetical protein [Wenyingzhuangia heitensis]
MKKIILTTALVFISIVGFSQEITAKNNTIDVITSIKNTNNSLVLNGEYKLTIGNDILIYLPSSEDFLFVKKKKSLLSAKLAGKLAGIVESGAMVALGTNTTSIEGLTKTIKVINTAQTVQYGADALEKINALDISKKAKKIAGRKAEVLGWDATNNIIEVKIGIKKYEVHLQEAIVTKEIKLI